MNNTVVVEFNVTSSTYDIKQYPITSTEVDFIFSFVNGTRTPLVFNDNLSFGITFKDSNNLPIIIKSWPEPGSSYISTDQDFLEFFKVTLMNGTLYKITLWTKFAGINSAIDYELQMPMLETYPNYEVT